jgi:predicted nucleotidyltransferase component of viral defense system
MIPRAYVDAWRAEAPWSSDPWVEQDLVISRALVAIFQDDILAERLAFRGGTALYKLHLRPAARYSEDIDLVQVTPRPIGETLDRLREVLDPWLGEPRRQFKDGRVNLVYRFDSEGPPSIRLRLKVEINSREHFSVLGLRQVPFAIDNRWCSGSAMVTTYALDELLGTKLRALYQRKKGRDLFDLWTALEHGGVDADRLVACFERYMQEGGHAASRAQVEANLDAKAASKAFRGDIAPLLRPDIDWDFDRAMAVVLDQLVSRLPGEAWRGEG